MTSGGAGPIGYVRVFTDADGVTRLEDLELATAPVDFAPPAPPVSMTSPEPASGVVFLRFPAGWTDPAHPAPARQYVVVLAGEMLGSVVGEERRFGPGTICLLEDTHGPGHGLTALTDLTMAVVRL